MIIIIITVKYRSHWHCVCGYVKCRAPNDVRQVSVVFRVKDSLASGVVNVMSVLWVCKEYSWF